jgi:polyisoprenoid-binding protein YceI
MKNQFTKSLTKLSIVAILATGGVAMAQQKIDSKKSIIKWEGSKVVGGKHWGHIGIKSADLMLDAKGEPTLAKIVIDVGSIEVKDLQGKKAESLKGHLLSKDFFEAEKFSEATFVAKKFVKVPGNKTKYTVEGDLTIKGITNTESLAMEVKKEKGATKVEGVLKFDRTKYNVMYSSGKLIDTAKDSVISDDILLDIKLAVVN